MHLSVLLCCCIVVENAENNLTTTRSGVCSPAKPFQIKKGTADEAAAAAVVDVRGNLKPA